MTIHGAVLLPTAFFPPVSYFVHMISSNAIFIEQMETFPKQTFRNRCEIMTEAGKANLIVPVIKPQGNHTLTKNVEICYLEPWNKRHWKTLRAGYSSSPFFSYYADNIQPLFESQEANLVLNNHHILKTILSLTGINPALDFTQDYVKKTVNMSDLRTEISLEKFSTKIEFPEYPQVFRHKFGFIPNLSILDLLFNLGPDALGYLEGITRLINRKL